MMEKLVSLVKQTGEDNNVNDHALSLFPALAYDTSMSKDIVDDFLTLPNSTTFFLMLESVKRAKYLRMVFVIARL